MYYVGDTSNEFLKQQDGFREIIMRGFSRIGFGRGQKMEACTVGLSCGMFLCFLFALGATWCLPLMPKPCLPIALGGVK